MYTSWVAREKQTTKSTGPAVGELGGMHDYTECSSKGSCNRDTGTCDCYEGFTGLACSRQLCPNSCSGHGRCISNSDFNSDYKIPAGSSSDVTSFNSQFWDAGMTRQCECDRGWEGYACDMRMCAVGADPLVCE